MIKKKVKKNISFVKVFISVSYNNTMIVATERNGDVVAWHTPKLCGFKGARRATPHAATETANELISKLKLMGVKTGQLILKGISPGRDAAIKSMQVSGIQFEKIYDKTGYAHNGVRPKGMRRV